MGFSFITISQDGGWGFHHQGTASVVLAPRAAICPVLLPDVLGSPEPARCHNGPFPTTQTICCCWLLVSSRTFPCG